LATTSDCPVCDTALEHFDSGTVMHQYAAEYLRCPGCGLVATRETPWLAEAYSTAIHTADKGLLRRARWETPDDDVSHDRPDGEPGPEDVVLADEACTAVRAAVAALSRRRREFVHALFYRPDANYVTVAVELSMPVGSIGPTRGRVLQSLRCTLEPAGYRGSEPGGRPEPVGAPPGLVA